MKKLFLIALLLNYKFLNCTVINDIKIVNFDISAQLDTKRIKYLNNDKFTAKLLKLYRTTYQKNNLSKIIPDIEPKIPKIIHQVWLGSSFPEKFKFITNKWKKMHPDWEYKLWNDNNIKELFPLYNQKIFNECKNLGEKSDIIRYEILYRFGGVYVDIDYECLQNFDILNHSYEFYAGMEPFIQSPLFIGNSIIGSKSQHPILKKCIETIKDFRKEATVPRRTGPLHLTRAFCDVEYLKNVFIFTPSYLYPIRSSLNSLKKLNKKDNIYQESLGIHYWAGSWDNK